MKAKFVLLTLMFFLVGVVNANDGWLTDFKKAQAQSLKDKKPMLVNFTGSDWCGWCIKLDREVFSKKEFQKWAKENVILVKLDFPRKSKQTAAEKKANRALANKYGVRGYPTILFINGKGEAVGKSGYMKGGPSAWTKSASKIISKK